MQNTRMGTRVFKRKERIQVKLFSIHLIIIPLLLLSGCATIQRANQANELEDKVALLEKKLEQLRKEKGVEIEQLSKQHTEETERLLKEKNDEIEELLVKKKENAQLIIQQKEKALSELEAAKRDLEQSLKREIGDYKARLEMTERGLVITFLSEVFFDSGKDTIRNQGREAVQKVAQVLNNNVSDSNIAIEGHTDDAPIQHSNWKSNWELSSARSLAVLHYLIDECQVKSDRLSANGYGEYHPVASNETPQGKQQNRRVEIIILPAKVTKVKGL